MDFELKTNLSTALPRDIEFNFEEQKAWLQERLEYYNNLVVTEDTIKEGKEDRAALNKLKDALETRRKEIKKEWSAPLVPFELKVKELVSLIDQPIAAIDDQIKAFDDKRRQEKQLEVEAIYDATVPETLRDIIPLEVIANPKWLNATTTKKSVQEAISDIVKRTNADMMLLDTVEDEYKAAVRETYISTLDIAAAMAKKDSLKAASEAFRQREEAQANQTPSTPEIQPEAPKPTESGQETEPERVYTLRLEFQLTQTQANGLKKYLIDNQIQHVKI